MLRVIIILIYLSQDEIKSSLTYCMIKASLKSVSWRFLYIFFIVTFYYNGVSRDQYAIY